LLTSEPVTELRTKKVAELWLRTFKIGLPQFRNSPVNTSYPAVPRPVLLLSRPFFSAQGGLKNKPKTFFYLICSQETDKGAKLTTE
jgi:hypothetical protein